MPRTELSIDQLAPFEKAGSLTAPERAAFSVATLYAKWLERDQPSETAYLRVLPDARQSILLRLVGGLFRDHPEGLPEPRFIAFDEQSRYKLACDALPPIELGSLLADLGVSETRSQLALLPFPASETLLVVPVKRTYGFARYWLTTPVVAASSSTTIAVQQPSQIIHLLEREVVFPDSAHAERFAHEIDESVANLALAYLTKETCASQFSDVQGGVFDVLRHQKVLARIISRFSSDSSPTVIPSILCQDSPGHDASDSLTGELSTITAAVVGVIFNFAVWFALLVLFGTLDEQNVYGMRLLIPEFATLDIAALLISVGAFVALLRFEWGMLRTLGSATLVGMLYQFFLVG